MQHESVTSALNTAIDTKGDLVLDGPPCPDCLHWRPSVLRDHTGGVRGFQMCQVGRSPGGVGMKPDFSCYTPKPDPVVELKTEIRGATRSAAKPMVSKV